MRTTAIVLGVAIWSYAAPGLAEDTVAPEAGAYSHDGFYLRGSLGVGFHHTSIETNRSVDGTANASGVAGAGDVMIGGSPMAGLVLGGALFGDFAPQPKVTLEGRDAKGDFVESSTGMVAVFVDAYLDPKSGFHFGGAIGFIGHTLDDADNPTDQEQTHEGFGAALFGGYDFWVAPQWSLGGMLRLTGGVGKHDVVRAGVGVTEKATASAFAVLFTGVYH